MWRGHLSAGHAPLHELAQLLDARLRVAPFGVPVVPDLLDRLPPEL
jgi:hypothetical protein